MTTTWTKTYTDPRTCQTAAANHQWLTQQMCSLSAPLRLPRLRRTAPCELSFDYVLGRHARPRDLVMIAEAMGHFHQAVHHDTLGQARLDEPFRASLALSIPDFITPRRDHIRTRLESGRIPGATLTAAQAVQTIESAADAPAAIYTDANLRNLMVTGPRVAMVDYDCLTLAPFGYDLAKLIVSLAMTHGPLPPAKIADALASYNHSLTTSQDPLPAVTWRDLMQWSEIHHILTSPYLGRHGYRHGWHQTRPTACRPSQTHYYLDIARAIAARGDCLRSQVGAVIVANSVVIAADCNRCRDERSCLAGDCPRLPESQHPSRPRLQRLHRNPRRTQRHH